MGQGATGSAAASSAGWFSDITDNHPDGMVVADDGALIVYVNPRASRILGISAEELLGQDIRKAIPLQEYDGRSWWDCTDPWNGWTFARATARSCWSSPGCMRSW